MKPLLSSILICCIYGVQFAAAQSIYVGQPKIYDDYYLQSALDSAKAQLAQLKPLDSATLLSHIGAAQGADLRQTSVAIQAGSVPTPQVVTTTPMTDAVAGGLIKDANGLPVSQTQTTQNSVSPTTPTPTAPVLTVPSNLMMGGLDTLNEQMQLNSEIISLQLLLDGAISDRVGTSNGRFKKRVTIGIPITIDPGDGSSTKNKAVEAEMVVCDSNDSRAAPSIITLLPKERTYNVASLVDKSWLVGAGGLIGGVLSVGGSFMWGHKQFYLIQQQDTVAIETNPSSFTGAPCGRGHGVSFAWQFRPVLGQQLVRGGMREVFVQLAYEDPGNDSVPPVHIRAGWKKFNIKTGAVGAGDVTDVPVDPLHNPKSDLKLLAVRVKDVGQGTVLVRGSGDFMPGTRVRIGPTNLDNVVLNDHLFEFAAPAKALITQRVFLVNRDGREWELARPGESKVEENGKSALISKVGPGLARILPGPGMNLSDRASAMDGSPIKAQKSPGGNTEYFAAVPETREFSKDSKIKFQSGETFIVTVKDTVQYLTIQEIAVTQYSNKLSRVEVSLSRNTGSGGDSVIQDVSEDGDAFNKNDSPLVAMIGDKIFGLQDSPFLLDPQDRRNDNKLIFLAPTDLLNAYKELTVQRILWGEQYRDHRPFNAGGPATFGTPSLMQAGEKVTLGISGTQIPESICAIWPDSSQATIKRVTANLVLITMGKQVMTDLRQIALGTKNSGNCDGSVLTAVLDVPEDAKPRPEKPKLKDQTVSLKPGDKAITIEGSRLSKIATIHAGDAKLTFRLNAKEDAVTVDLDGHANQEGVFYLDVQYDDKTTDRYKVTVKDGKPISK